MAKTQAGLEVYFCVTPQPISLDRAGFEALTWLKVSNVGSVGQSGPSTNLVNYDEMDTDVTQKSKGITDAQNTPIECARNLSDAGQLALRDACLTPFNYAMKFVDKDAPQPSYSNTVTYRRGVLTGPTRAGGRNEDFITDVFTLGQNQREVLVKPEPSTVPVNTKVPSITGANLTQGTTLTAVEGVWTNEPTSYTYQWQGDTSGNGTFVNIVGATNKTYTLAVGQAGDAVRVQVTAINGAGFSAVANSLAVGLVV